MLESLESRNSEGFFLNSKFFLLCSVVEPSDARCLDQKVATFFAKSSQKVANFYRQSLLNKMRFLCKINTFLRDFFLFDLEIFQKIFQNSIFFTRFPLKSWKSHLFLANFPQFLKVATFEGFGESSQQIFSAPQMI